MSASSAHITRLYLITPPHIADIKAFGAQLENAFSGGDVACVQLRLKDADDAEVLNAANALIPICHKHNAAFILNDRPDLAVKCGADGVHLGQDDAAKYGIAETKKLLGEERMLGISCHDSRHMAMDAGELGADYVAFGAFYPTKSKNPEYLARYGTPTAELLTWWQAFAVLPCVAIGGMTPANCVPLVRAGADFIAAITAVWEHSESPAAAVAEFNTVFNAPKT